MLVVFFAIVNMCELVTCRPHGQTTRMTVSTKKPAQNPVNPEEQQHQNQEWKIEHIQHKIIKGDIKAYYCPASFYHFVWSVQTSEKEQHQAPRTWCPGTRKPWKSSRSIFPWRLRDGCHLAFKKLNQFNPFFGLDDKPLEFGWFNDV